MSETKRIFEDGVLKVCARDRKKNYRVRLQMLNGKKNRNGWVYENIEKHLDEFTDIPILYSVIGNKVANSHDFEIKTDPKTGKKYASFIGATSEHMAGWIVDTIGDKPNARIENIDGVEWVVAEGIFPTFYNKEFLDELEANGGEMHVSIETLVTKSRVVDEVEYEEEWEVVGVTVLGRGVTEAVAGANIRAASVAEDGFEKLKLRAASYYEKHAMDDDSANDKHDNDTTKKKEQKKHMIFNAEDLKAKFNGYDVLGTSGATVALLSANGRFYSYTFVEGEETVVPERIKENAVMAVIGEGEEAVNVSGEQIATPLVAKINALSASNDALAKENAEIKGVIAKMKEDELKRRKNAAKAAIESRMNEIKDACDGIEVDVSDLCKDEKLAEYAECEKDGEFCGDKAACNDVDARCMSILLSAKQKVKKQYIWEDAKDEGAKNNSADTMAKMLSKYDK